MRKIKVGLIQQSNTADIRMNLMNLAKSIEACAAHGAQLIVLQELHNSLYFCQTENTNLFDLPNRFPVLPPDFIRNWQQLIEWFLSPLFLRNVLPGSIIILPLFLTVTEALQENTVKCTFLMILPTTRSSISLPEI